MIEGIEVAILDGIGRFHRKHIPYIERKIIWKPYVVDKADKKQSLFLLSRVSSVRITPGSPLETIEAVRK